jgi:hypothetical protein
VARGQFGGRQPVARGELGVAEFLRGRRLAQLQQASGPHWAASAKGGGRPTRLFIGAGRAGWAAWEWGKESGWSGRARLPAGFRRSAKIKLKIPFLFPNLFTIYKLI